MVYRPCIYATTNQAILFSCPLGTSVYRQNDPHAFKLASLWPESREAVPRACSKTCGSRKQLSINNLRSSFLGMLTSPP